MDGRSAALEPAHPHHPDALRAAFLEAILAPDARRARAIVLDAADAGVPAEALYCEVLQPALHEVGRRWADATLTVAQEHLATQMTQAVLAQLAVRLTASGRSGNGRVAVIACSPGELHSIGPQMISDFLEADGWTTLLLGPDVPPDDVAELARANRADLVAVSTTLPAHLLSATLTCTALRRLDPPPFVIVGGQAYAGDAERAAVVGADAYAGDPRTLLALTAERFGADAGPVG